MTVYHLSLQDARHLHLAAQGLLNAPRRKAVKQDVLASIRRMALLQIDTIHVVARSPYLVLFSRLGLYQPQWLDQLLAEQALFEYWAHEACFVPIEDYRLLRHRMLDPAAMGWKYPVSWMDSHRQDIEQLLEHIRQSGPVKSSHFARQGDNKGSGWWDWKPEKRHLEVLFTAGRLMVAERQNFQRVYDLAERLLPDWDDEKHLPDEATAQGDMVRQSCRALGLVKPAWVADYYRLKRGKQQDIVHQLADLGELIPVRVEGFKHDMFVHTSLQPELELAMQGQLSSNATTLLSPFDPVVWDRKRASELFGFDYRIECYTPAPKRQYGYFVLPILHKGQLVGRLDAKAHRAQGVFEVKALYLEPGIKATRSRVMDINKAIQKLADWHGTPAVSFGRVPAGWPDLVLAAEGG